MGNQRGQTAITVLLNATSAWSLPEKLSSACAATCTAGLVYTRLKTPPRPRGQRPEPESRGQGIGSFPEAATGFHMAFGIGAFPFGFFATGYSAPGERADTDAPRPSSWQDSLFLFIAIFFFFWLLSV
ncbi:E3 ubiquitin-protein ligase RNF5 [Ophiophagus hannah]|uniref:E3 ubiquitin-protein ligase RNF5 n=1 Tax=Ophiophagus hannah TaxID=8665 RepID=V8NEF8_OPHHA|nr:E3 ubiquitin-protein ligase RNF5 [Ophiophagus hannah]